MCESQISVTEDCVDKEATEEKFLLLLCGLPSTGKTTLAQRLSEQLKQYKLVSQNEVRRKMGMKRMPRNQDRVLRAIDRLIADYLRSGNGAVFESVNRCSFRRQQIYGVASGCGNRVITLEIICSEKTAKTRIRKRPKGDNLISDPQDPAIYDKIKALWQSIDIDFKYPGEDHVAYLRYDNEKKILEKIILRKGMGKIIRQIEKILKSY